ncbi:MAG: hypothetical protein WCR42_01480 [bacterium]
MHNILFINPLFCNEGGVVSITIIITIILFFIKEIIEGVRRFNARKNKLKAISFLLSEELELNHWAFIKLFDACDTASTLFKDYNKPKISTTRNRFGMENIEFAINEATGTFIGHTLPIFVSKQFLLLSPSLAELDSTKAFALQRTYDDIYDLEYYRQSLILHINNEQPGDPELNEGVKGFIEFIVDKRQYYFNTLENGYKVLTGKPLENFKLR